MTAASSSALVIRDEHEDDHFSIADLTARAFAGAEHSDQTEPAIISRLRAANDLAVSLVAVECDTVIGHVAFSPVTVDGVHGGWFGLGPVSVEPDHQSKGVGSALIWEGLDRLRAQGAAGCVVLGDSAYYSRFGFEQAGDLRYEGAPTEYFMRLVLGFDELPTGSVDYAPAFIG